MDTTILRALVDELPDLAWTALPDGHIDFYNRRWFEYTGTTHAEMEGWGWEKVHHPQHLAGVVSAWRHALATGEPFESEFPLRAGDGTYRWFLTRARPLRNAAGAIERWIGTNTDVNDLRESRHLLVTLIDNLPELAWTALANGHIDFYNRRWFEYTGTTFEEMQGWGWRSVHDPTMLPLVIERWQASLETGQPFEMEFPLRRRDGQFRWFLTRVRPLRDGDGRLVRWFGTNTDIHELRESRERTAALLAEVSEQSQETRNAFFELTRARDQAQARVRELEAHIASSEPSKDS